MAGNRWNSGHTGDARANATVSPATRQDGGRTPTKREPGGGGNRANGEKHQRRPHIHPIPETQGTKILGKRTMVTQHLFRQCRTHQRGNRQTIHPNTEGKNMTAIPPRPQEAENPRPNLLNASPCISATQSGSVSVIPCAFACSSSHAASDGRHAPLTPERSSLTWPRVPFRRSATVYASRPSGKARRSRTHATYRPSHSSIVHQ